METTYNLQNVNGMRRRFRGGGMGKGMGKGRCRNLCQIKRGDTVTVDKVAGCGAIRKRLMEMGITKGVKVRIQKVAPLGDPMQISVRGYELLLRKAEALNVMIDDDKE